STMFFIKNRDFADSLKISEMLIRRGDHDLISKAVGWVLREIGKRDLDVEEAFIKRHLAAMPPTMLRYAIERFPEQKRLAYLEKRRQLAESR
ncbi:MAG TPA: DNA alkylation repair protein, partial [Nitrososphaera sp.]|nr:DNA alkylation repair protein [Nitrososphaera sp.]